MYLIRRGQDPKVAHIWNGVDTLCRMYSTGGMNKKKFKEVVDTSLPICANCKNKMSGSLGKNPVRFQKFSEKDVGRAVQTFAKKPEQTSVASVFPFVTSDQVWHSIMRQHGPLLSVVNTLCTDGRQDIAYGVLNAAHPLLMIRETWDAKNDPEKKAISVEYWLYIPVPAK